jgi:general secretion pathway protein C
MATGSAARWAAFGVWALVAASAAYWSFRMAARPAPLPPQTRVALAQPSTGADLTRLLGARPAQVAPAPEPAADSRFRLVGVVAGRSGELAAPGVALIAVDGKAPRAFRVGSVVEGDQVLQSVQPRGATLGPRDGAAQTALALPPLPPPRTGTLPAAMTPAADGAAIAAQPPEGRDEVVR